MNAGQSYSVSITMKNTGSRTWSEASWIRLGGVGDASGVAAKFGASRFFIPKGTNVLPGAQYTFTFTMTAPATPGTYSPQYKMVWDKHQWFGSMATRTINVVSKSSASTASSGTIPTPTPTPATSSAVIAGTGDYGAGTTYGGYTIGGGTGYPTYTSATSTYTVKTLAEFKSRMVGGSAPATAGQVVFIPSGTTIDLTGQTSITIPAGVTIASDRGYNGAKGATIKKYTGSGYSMLEVGGSNVRVTGLVLEGPNPAPETLNYLVMGILNMNGYTGLVVDNNEIWGWSYAGVFSNGAPTAGRPNIHHNYIHHNQGDGYGYGVNVNGGDALVEANTFDYNRHSITGGGLVGERYEFRYNIHLGHGSVVGGTHVDVHENEHYSSDRVACAGTEYRIHHNTVNQGSGTAQQAFVHIRDVPQTGAYIYNNLINTNWGSSTNNDGAQTVIYQSCDYSNRFGGIYATNNMWKGTLYTTNTGIVWEQKHA
jgi:hypothetical protein